MNGAERAQRLRINQPSATTKLEMAESLREPPVAFQMHCAKVDPEWQRAATAEIPVIRPVGNLVKFPFPILKSGRPRLRVARRVVFVVADGHAAGRIKTDNCVAINNAAMLWHRI